MPAGTWEKCGVTKKRSSIDGANRWTCQKKKGHTKTGSPDNRKHSDTKTFPYHYWKDEENV